MEEFDRALGERLRAARRRRGWSLHDVEEASSQEFKASVLGAYERGERALSVQRLSRLATIYGVSAAHLIPAGEGGEAAVTLDLDAIDRVDDATAAAMDRFFAAIQLRRRGSASPAVRKADLELLTSLLRSDPAAVEDLLGSDPAR